MKDLQKKGNLLVFINGQREKLFQYGNRTFKPSKGFAKRAAEGDADPCSKQRSETPNISASGRFLVTKPNEDKKSGLRN